VGRNIWSEGDVGRAVRAFKAVIHDGVTPKEALKA
jgi:class I fructose-bisphosphate aldolase